jgi:hypothetical protein
MLIPLPGSRLRRAPNAAGGVHVGAEHGDVADLAAGLDPLAVQVDADVRVGQDPVQRPDQVGVGAAEHVGHHRDRRAQRRRTQRQVGDGAQVVLELAGDRTLDAPVPGVVRPHGELVDDDLPVRALHQLHGQDADDPEFVGDAATQRLEGRGARGVEAGCGGGRLVADPVALDRLGHRVGDRLPAGPASDQHRQFPGERDELLGDDDGVGRRVRRGVALGGAERVLQRGERGSAAPADRPPSIRPCRRSRPGRSWR